MSEHYPRNTVSVAAWCRKCQRETQHTVSDRRLGYCIPCYEQQTITAAAPKPIPERGLFDELEETV